MSPTRSKKPMFVFPPNFGSYLAVVFEFFGFLGLGGVGGYVAQEYLWPEHSAWIFPVVFLSMFGLGLWFMVRQAKRVAEKTESSDFSTRDAMPPTLDPDTVSKQMQALDERFARLPNRRPGRKESGADDS
ncbi:MAG: hypothetical protein KDK37_03120 [Leptospiraceae bacterium]|nr:hypothetical protein [Leptospiraceae bacterium]